MIDIASYQEMSKPRITTFVMLMAVLGYVMGSSHGDFSWLRLMWLLIGTGLVCSGSAILNHYQERDLDALMVRTKNRPLPTGRVKPTEALIVGMLFVLVGVGQLLLTVNLLTAFLSLLSAFMYILVYTPMKRISWWNTTIGAIPGALPPLGGWAAATGDLDWGGWILFWIMFVWQHPHFFAIACLCREDYRRAGYKMLPVVDQTGWKTQAMTIVTTLILIPVSLLPTLHQMTGWFYALGSLIAGLAILMASRIFIESSSLDDARRLLKATVYYLPVIVMLMMIERLVFP